ncbi:DUF2550 domain-containing protein [Devriesea agamarum]|uniref:DUF2550 domain-containing protein n=1 Tax=Devriesea agamarum TaxID=472569 RepID=UPI00071D5AC9|nr:DUF2550 domain-containing protein [Devriesea agamarum]
MNAPTALVVVGALLCLLAGVYVVRQFWISRQRGSLECAIWRRSAWKHGWQFGLMRYGTLSLRWYRAFSLRPWPSVVIRRNDIQDMTRRLVDSGHPGIEPHCFVELTRFDGRTLRLLMSRPAYNGLAAWMEAAPAGEDWRR